VRVNVYTDLALAAIHAKKSGALRLWCFARMLDQGGRGCILAAELYKTLQGLKVTHTTFYRWLAQAKAAQFITEGRPGVLYLAALAKVAGLLKVDRLTRKVEMPALKLTAKGWRAFVFAATHNGRPTSRQTLEALTGISQRTQARYDHLAKTKRKKSIYVTDRPASQLEAVKEHSTEATAFIVYDKKSRRRVVAHRRPDMRTPYGQPEAIRPKWEINLKLLSSAKIRNHSFSIGATGTQMIFYRTLDQATHAAQRNGRLDLPQVDTFYPIKCTQAATFYARA